MMTKNDPVAINAPITIWGITRSKNPRRRCGVKTCRKPLNSVTIDHGRIQKEKKVGRPKKGKPKTRYTKIGDWCVHCQIFYYLDGTPNYKLHLRSGKK